MNFRVYPKLELMRAWDREKLKYDAPAGEPPRCLRCGSRMSEQRCVKALSRSLNVDICDLCGMDEALADMAGRPMPISEWHAVREGLISPVEEDSSTVVLRADCPFPDVFDGPKKPSVWNSGQMIPDSEIVYTRSYIKKVQWYTGWFPCAPTPDDPALVKEIDAVMDGLLAMPELHNIYTLGRLAREYAEPTEDPLKFNLYGQSEHFNLLLCLIHREKDYNLYVHFYQRG